MIKHIKYALLLSLVLATKFALAMTPSTQDSKNCFNSACTKEAANICSGCKNAHYCGKDCQISDWKKEHKHICKLIKTCVEDKRLMSEGAGPCDNQDKNILEVIQVALGNKPVAFVTYKTSNNFNQLAPSFIPRVQPNDKIKVALVFAQQNGASVESYYDRDFNEVKLVYAPENKKAASYFSTNKRSPLEHPDEAIDFLLEGILLGYKEENIKLYFSAMQKNFKLSSIFNLNDAFEVAKVRASKHLKL